MKRAVAAATLGLVACAPTGATDVTIVMSHGNCQRIERGATVIDYAELAQLRGAQLLDIEASPATGDLTLVAVSEGTRPTLGYRLEPDGPPHAQGDVLTIRVAMVAPPPEAVVAQMLSQPCVVFGIEAERYRRVRIEDADGAEIGTVPLGGDVSE